MHDFVAYAVGNFRNFLSPGWMIFFISALPVFELRGGLIAASLMGINWILASVICIIGNILPVPFIILFMKQIFEKLKNTRFSGFVNKIEEKAAKSSEKVFKYKRLGLYIFVALPIPGTGAWTGALVASLFGIEIKSATISIFLGLVTATVVMLLFSYVIPSLIFA